MNGLTFSASSRITNCARRFARVVTVELASEGAALDVFTGTRKRRWCLPGESALAELRVLFPSIVEGIVSSSEAQWEGGKEVVVWEEGALGGLKMERRSNWRVRLHAKARLAYSGLGNCQPRADRPCTPTPTPRASRLTISFRSSSSTVAFAYNIFAAI